MRDGTLLAADVHRPAGPGPHPVLVHRTPYGRSLAQAIVLPHPSWFVRHGFIVATVDVRGRYDSGGDFVPFVHEELDGHDTVEWAAALPGSTGRVGMYGASYAGAVQLQAAASRPPSLACIVPAMTSDDFYEDWTYEGGALNLAFTLSWAYAHLGIADAVRAGRRALAEDLYRLTADLDAVYAAPRLADLPFLDDELLARTLRPWLEHEQPDAFWRALSFRDRVPADLPALHITGWFDGFSAGTVRSHERMTERGSADDQWLLAGPWAHIPWADRVAGATSPARTREVVAEHLLRFLRHYLLDQPTTQPRRTVFDLGTGAWTTPDRWSGDGRVEWFLDSGPVGANSRSGDGRLLPAPRDVEGRDVWVHQPLFPVPSLGGHACGEESVAPIGAVDQGAVQVRNDVLVYETPPLPRAVTIAGRPRVHLHCETTGASADWAVRLCVVGDDDRSVNISNGIRRTGRGSTPHPVTVDLSPVVFTVAAGQRLALAIASSDFPHYSVNTGEGGSALEADRLTAAYSTQTVLLGATTPSRLELPVR